MPVVDVWTGAKAAALQRACRLTNERFADRLGTVVRTVAKWNANPLMEPGAELQEALDTLLGQSSDQQRERFELLVEQRTELGNGAAEPAELTAAEGDLNQVSEMAAVIDWLERSSEWTPGEGRRRVVEQIAQVDPRALRDQGAARGRVTRTDIAAALRDYYRPTRNYGFYEAKLGNGERIETSLLTCPDWLDLRCNLNSRQEMFSLVGTETPEQRAEPAAAALRLAEAVRTGMRIVDAPIYSLSSVDLGKQQLRGSFRLASFSEYALTTDLLEAELIDAIAAETVPLTSGLPLREAYLPDEAAMLDVGHRLCAGGALALTAIARPAGRHRPADYLLLVQERSGRVLNAARRLAVIPKAFHQPLSEDGEDVHVGATLRREMEEELFGRAEVDSVLADGRYADPMHTSRLSEPMRWLNDHGPETWQCECTSFGLNAVSGNYEFASLVVIHDEEFWQRYGGHIATNWEADGIKRYSTAEPERLADLAADEAWTNEGVFALLQGLRRLGEIDGERAQVPAISWEVS